MKYLAVGEVHKDFHLATYTSLRYVLETYGIDFLRELFRRTAQCVYFDIYTALKAGDPACLLEHWRYYYAREGGEFQVREEGETFVFDVRRCPAVSHLLARGIEVDDDFYLQVKLMNDGWSEGTAFVIDTEVRGTGAYTMTVRKRREVTS